MVCQTCCSFLEHPVYVTRMDLRTFRVERLEDLSQSNAITGLSFPIGRAARDRSRIHV